MRLSYLAYSFSIALMFLSFVLLTPIIVALIFKENSAILPFIIASASALMTSAVLRKVVKGVSQIKSINDIKKR